MNPFIISLSAVGPIFILILIGWILRRKKKIDEGFTRMGSQLVFSISLPALLILKLTAMPREALLSPQEIWLLMGLTLAVFLLTWIPGAWLLTPQDRGVFSQGAFRGNMAIIGLAVILQVLGERGMQRGALYTAILMPVYNILAILAITLPLSREENRKESILKLLAGSLKKLITNPLILAVTLGLLLFAFHISLPEMIRIPLDYLSRMTLPLALICIGGSLDFSHLKKRPGTTLLAAVIKVMLLPLATYILASMWIGDPFTVATLTIFTGVPTAVSSFPMAQSMGGNGEMAANIVALTTLLSIPALGVAISLLSMGGYI